MIIAAAAIIVSCSAADYGAVGDGIADDRIALQTAIISCSEVTIPAGRYLVTRAPFAAFDLFLPAGHSVVGAGREATILVQAPEQAANVRQLHVEGADVTVSDLTLDGDRANQILVGADVRIGVRLPAVLPAEGELN